MTPSPDPLDFTLEPGGAPRHAGDGFGPRQAVQLGDAHGEQPRADPHGDEADARGARHRRGLAKAVIELVPQGVRCQAWC